MNRLPSGPLLAFPIVVTVLGKKTLDLRNGNDHSGRQSIAQFLVQF